MRRRRCAKPGTTPRRAGSCGPAGCSPARCSASRCCSDATATARSSRCATSARIAACRSPRAGSTAREIECCYHGWRFAADGRCTAIPSLVEGQEFDLGRIAVPRYPAREVQGNIWVYFGVGPGDRARKSRCSTGSPAIGGAAAGRDDAVRGGDRPRRRRADGPGARALRAPRLVVALGRLDPRKGEGVRAVALGLHDEPARAVEQFAGLSAARRRARDRDRLSPAERPHRADPRRPLRGHQPDRADPGRRPDDRGQPLHLLDGAVALRR